VYGEEVERLLTVAAASIELASQVPALPTSAQQWEATELRLEGAVVAPLEQLSRAAHHLCDLLHHLAEQRGKVPALRSQEEGLRRRILDLVTARIVDFKQAAAERIAALSSAPGSDRAALGKLRGLLMGTLAQLLKRAAEAGNDVFGSAIAPEDKLGAAEVVHNILEVTYRYIRCSPIQF
jgi:sirohydrochlorin ferrochelatase